MERISIKPFSAGLTIGLELGYDKVKIEESEMIRPVRRL